MSIKQSVGNGGVNNKLDVKLIQAALTLSQSPALETAFVMAIDGIVGKKQYLLLNFTRVKSLA